MLASSSCGIGCAKFTSDASGIPGDQKPTRGSLAGACPAAWVAAASSAPATRVLGLARCIVGPVLVFFPAEVTPPFALLSTGQFTPGVNSPGFAPPISHALPVHSCCDGGERAA